VREATKQFLGALDEHTLADLTTAKPRLGRLLQLAVHPH
jgi:hypothetical protein